MASRRHVAGKGSIAEFRSTFAQIARDLEPLTAEVAASVAHGIRDGAVQRSEGQYKGSNPFGLEVKPGLTTDFGKGVGIYADWYWFFGEFGTSTQAARPYMVPALEEEYGKVYPKARAAFSRLPKIHKA